MGTKVSLFSGGGLADVGCKSAGYMPVGAVEYDPQIAAVYARNHGDHIQVCSVDAVDYRQYAGIDLGWMSPVCVNASVAKVGGKEEASDTLGALGCMQFIRHARPRYMALENVWGYRKFQSFSAICDVLTECGYTFTFDHVNAADFGVPQTRKRLILRASRVGEIAPLVPTHMDPRKKGFAESGLLPWNGWYAAIADLIPTLPESRFAPWQLARLPEALGASSFLAERQGARNGPLVIRREEEPMWTLRAVGRNTEVANAFIVEPGFHAGITVRNGDTPSGTVRATSNRDMPRAVLVQGTGTLDVRDGGTPSATVVATVGAKAAMPEAIPVGDQRRQYADGERRPFTVRAMEKGGAVPRALLVDGGAEKRAPLRGLLEHGRVVSMTPRALGRFQTLPDWYVLPEKKALACRIIGNGVPCLLAEVVARSFGE